MIENLCIIIPSDLMVGKGTYSGVVWRRPGYALAFVKPLLSRCYPWLAPG